MMIIRKAADRGHADRGWLDSRHTFSFADYHDKEHMGFRTLRVLNEDRVQGGKGFDEHPHRDMEILSYVLSGGLAHKDSLGTGAVIRPGDVQRMSAGTGVVHSEFNASADEPVHFLQIWLMPMRNGTAPSYQQKTFSDADKRGQLRLVASPDGSDGSVSIQNSARVYAGLFRKGERAEMELAASRHAWVQVARGVVRVDDSELSAGDGIAISNESSFVIEGVDSDDAEVLVFNLS